MITGVAFCPQAPLLVPDVAGAAAAELDALRTACRRAINRVAADSRIVVLGSAAVTSRFEASAHGSFAGFGIALDVSLGADGPGADGLPPSLLVGAWLLHDALGPGRGAVGFGVGPAGPAVELDRPDDRIALLVVGDGSACRSLKAPGYLDDRAAAYDASVAAALAAGDAAPLAGLDTRLGADLLAAGVPAWRAAGAALAGADWDAELLYDEAPYGVGYLVAAWTQQ